MDYTAERHRIEDRLTQVWRDMCWAREKERWGRYWALRRSWLALGRLHGELVQLEASERGAQLELLDRGVGRAHDGGGTAA